MDILKAGAVVLPAPVSLSSNNEIIWSSNTGRASDGTMIGDVVAEKRNLEISWGVLTETELALITKNLITGFFPISFRDDGMDITITSYRGTLKKEHLGRLSDGVYYYKSASVQIVQQ